MYVPKGTWHNAIALNARSLHLTVSLVYPTVADFVTWHLQQDKAGIPSRDIRLMSGCVDHTIEDCRRFLATLASRERMDDFMRAFYANKRCSRTRTNFPSLNVPRQTDRFRRVPFEVLTLRSSQPDRCDTYALGRIHCLTADECAVLSAVPRTGTISGGEIAKIGGGWDATARILEALMDHDLVTIVMDDV